MSDRITAMTPQSDALLFWSLSGCEKLSEPFTFEVELLSEQPRLDEMALLSESITINIPLPQLTSQRYLNGKITGVNISSQELSGTRYTLYRLRMESDLWPLMHDRNQRVFQHKSVPEIIKKLLSENNVVVEDKLMGSYSPWEYCVQYQESSLNFISRLMELEGIYYYFEHQAGQHKLILLDDNANHKPFAGYETINYQATPSGGTTSEEGISQWSLHRGVTPGLYSLNDYDFRKPYAVLLQARQNPASPQPGNIDVYDWPGHYVEAGQGEQYSRIRQQLWQSSHQTLSGTATALGIASGHTFNLLKAPQADDNKEYLVISTHYELRENRYASGDDQQTHQTVKFMVIPADIQYRPPVVARWPRTYGPQTAKVVCPAGQSIWTDKYGRVKVQFHWDREAKGDDTSSCWVRVASTWAGQGFGGIQIPRVNDEVVVDFINGDPDRPIITGRVYNEANMPPWDLPANATQMGFYSRTKDGASSQANALRFEDKPGEEEVYIRGQKDMNTVVLNDRSTEVGNDHSESVGGQQTIEIQKDQTQSIHGNQAETIDGDQTQTTQGNQTETIGGDQSQTIHGSQTEAIDGNQDQTIHGSQTVNVDGDQTQTAHGSQTETIGGNQTLFIKQNQAETVLIGKAETIGAAKALTIGAAYQVSVAALMNTSVGLNQSSQIGVSKKLMVGKDYSQHINNNKTTVVAKNNIIKAGQHIKFQAGSSFTVVCGKSKLVMDKSGKITLNGQELTVTTTAKQTFKARGDIRLKGKKIHEN
ncbi:type VI secretion system Vgr family protein [Serratia silvae]|uniref:Type VI secretion system tip protein VgrG n=1 Tax=Serratia silvae TaxID=2824122 RepID=A0ABT0KAV6_9GAMM|nr:type VI secretion system tip protein TssI/VgrG [Serratia silvae]MCL1029168.1 type VI secretion system tip protein VgrG [Serratia silvae]